MPSIYLYISISLQFHIQPLRLKLRTMPNGRQRVNNEQGKISKEIFVVHSKTTAQKNMKRLKEITGRLG